MVQKAVEMGVSRLQPVLTQHGQVTRINLERMRANAIEAAEQCGILSLPEIARARGAVAPGRAVAARSGGSCSAMKMPRRPIRSRRCKRCRGMRRLPF